MTDCIEWTGARNTDGYGNRWFRGRCWKAHRVAWVEANGEIPEEMHVLHHCDNPSCVNPEHLFLGTHADNMADMKAKKRFKIPPRRPGDPHPTAKLTQEQVDAIRSDTRSQRTIAADYGISQPNVSMIKTHTIWRAAS